MVSVIQVGSPHKLLSCQECSYTLLHPLIRLFIHEVRFKLTPSSPLHVPHLIRVVWASCSNYFLTDWWFWSSQDYPAELCTEDVSCWMFLPGYRYIMWSETYFSLRWILKFQCPVIIYIVLQRLFKDTRTEIMWRYWRSLIFQTKYRRQVTLVGKYHP